MERHPPAKAVFRWASLSRHDELRIWLHPPRVHHDDPLWYSYRTIAGPVHLFAMARPDFVRRAGPESGSVSPLAERILTNRMRLLIVHNSYLQPGGEEGSLRAELEALTSLGHDVDVLTVSNELIDAIGMVRAGFAAQFSWSAYREVRNRLKRTNASIVLVNNFFPLISPSVFYAARDTGVPSVLYLRNYRLLCPAATLFRSGAVCTECPSSGSLLPSIRHRCYRGSLLGSAAVAGMLAIHRIAGTWSRIVSRYVALSDFQADIMVQHGIPRGKVIVKPNYLQDDPGYSYRSRRNIAFVGRVTVEKGLDQVLSAWRSVESMGSLKERLIIAGDGPERQRLQHKFRDLETVDWLGAVDQGSVASILSNSRCLVFPSRWYEGMPRTIIEALARATPVVASDLGTMPEMVQPSVNGQLFHVGDTAALVTHLSSALRGDSEWVDMQRGARETFERRFAPSVGRSGVQSLLNQVARVAP
jgi:glycosyltransferase involved in cell wall biosynthesis